MSVYCFCHSLPYPHSNHGLDFTHLPMHHLPREGLRFSKAAKGAGSFNVLRLSDFRQSGILHIVVIRRYLQHRISVFYRSLSNNALEHLAEIALVGKANLFSNPVNLISGIPKQLFGL